MNQQNITLSAADLTAKSETVVRVVVKRADGKQAILFLSVQDAPGGVKGTLTVKVNTGNGEVEKSAVARYSEPVIVKGRDMT